VGRCGGEGGEDKFSIFNFPIFKDYRSSSPWGQKVHGRHQSAPSCSERFRVGFGLCGKYAGNAAFSILRLAFSGDNSSKESYIYE